MNQPDLMTAAEIAALCRVPPRTVAEKWCFKPGFPLAFKPGKRKMWDRAEVLAWLEKQRVRA